MNQDQYDQDYLYNQELYRNESKMNQIRNYFQIASAIASIVLAIYLIKKTN